MTLPRLRRHRLGHPRLLAAALLAALLFAAGAARAQSEPNSADMTSMIADLVQLDGKERLIASGNVEIFAQGRHLTASRLIYDQPSNRLIIEGPIVLQDASGTLIFADQADLDKELNDGILRGARVVLNQQTQLAAAELARSQGRFSELKQVVASSCEVCPSNPTPLWEIRASRVIHDQQDAQIYFYNARLHVVGLPVFYLPRLRVPDGTKDRVTGFLAPIFTSTSQLGVGLKLPYFITLGESADLTLTPYAAVRYTKTLEGRYRQAFAKGDLLVEGAVSEDSILPGKTRGYLFAYGSFAIPRDYQLNFNLQTTSDDQYLNDYDYSDTDRLTSAIGVLRTRPHERIDAQIAYYQSLRADDTDVTQPTFAGDQQWNRRYVSPVFDGWIDADLLSNFRLRPSNADLEGRDTAQMRGTLTFDRIWTDTSGLRLQTQGQINGDLKYIANDSDYPVNQAAITPTVAIGLGWPLSARSDNGTRYLLEPMAQLAWTARNTLDSPNDDSTLTELDAGNLFSLNRFPGLDRYEEGGRANLGLRWTRYAPSGWSLGLTGGRVVRAENLDQFPEGTALAGTTSNWLLGADLDFGSRLILRTTTLLDDSFATTQNLTRVTWQSTDLQLTAGYVWERQDFSQNLTDDLSEVALQARWNISDRWDTRFDLRQDLVNSRTNRAGMGVAYSNECVRLDLSVLQRFRANDAGAYESNTSYGLSVSLTGFGNNDSTPGRRRRCAQ